LKVIIAISKKNKKLQLTIPIAIRVKRAKFNGLGLLTKCPTPIIIGMGFGF
tara:strand:- start:5318 stop:5470 length:153 start_codon:yes stop_codon:yes gene_type:complete